MRGDGVTDGITDGSDRRSADGQRRDASRTVAHDYLLESWLELREAVERHPGIRRLLFDPVTGLPTTPLLFPRIESLLEERGEVSLLYVDIVKYSRIEEIYGWKTFDSVMRVVAEVLDHITGRELRDSDMVAELMISGNAFVVVLSPPREHLRLPSDDLETIARRVEDRVVGELAERIEPDVFSKFGCYVGCSTISSDPDARLERLVYEGLDRAMDSSSSRIATDARRREARLRDILDTEAINTLVHPVVDITDMRVIGYEALSRGPADDEFERPDKLFRVAYDTDLVIRLERLCRKKALEAAETMPDGRLLFVNIEPDAVADPQLRDATFSSLLAEGPLTPERVILEITERSAIVDFSAFRSTLEYLRALGFGVAVDDAGAGYGSLQCLAEVRPEWLKVDLSLVRGCDSDETRCGLIESLAVFAEKMGVGLIAEGIETREELDTLRELGVRYGQGFLFSLPVEPFPTDEGLGLDRLL